MFPFFVNYFNKMACYACPARLPVGHGLDLNQPTKRDGRTKNRKREPKKGNNNNSSKSQKKTTGGARMPSDRSARDSVQAHGQTRDLSKSVPRKELTMADGTIADTSSKFLKESSSSLSSSSSSSDDSSSAVGQSALPTLWGLGRTSTERRNGVGF